MSFSINKIETLTYDEAKAMANDEMIIKNHTCLFVDLGEDFGYSVLVFKNQKHIYFANDYELHHKYLIKENGKTEGRKLLKKAYIANLNNKLFTDEELMQDVSSYDDYRLKDYFLRNYWIMRFDYLSVWGNDKELYNQKKPQYPFFNNVSFCYVADKKVVEEANHILKNLEKGYKKLKKDKEEFRKMITYELSNHEACVTGTATDALDALGLKFDDLTSEQQTIVKRELKKQIQKDMDYLK